MQGSFEIAVIEINNFENPSKDLIPEYFTLKTNNLDFLHIKSGCITAIKTKEENSKLLVFADYSINEIQDEYRFPLDYFKLEL